MEIDYDIDSRAIFLTSQVAVVTGLAEELAKVLPLISLTLVQR